MLLSIGMIVKNEEKYLRDCLEALSPILQKLDSELIIVDTGSTDSTVEIAKEFTDKVYHFEWCDDFAAARNAAMKRTKGRWYMSIDADEIIEDAVGIIDFFKTGEYKKYNAASYVIRSFNSTKMKVGADFNAIRLIKLAKDSYYVNAVHEQFERVYEPVKALQAVANHYGYVTENNMEYIESKMKRNLKILFSELNKKPNSALIYLYISQTYRMLKDNKMALEYNDKGIEIARVQNDPVMHSLYANKIGIYVNLDKYNDILKVAEEYFESKNKVIGTDLEFHFAKAKSLFMLNMHSEAAKSYKKYLKFFKEFKQGLHRTIDTYQHALSFTSYSTYKSAILNLTSSLVKLGNYKEASKYLHSIPAEDYLEESDNDILNYLKMEFAIMEESDDLSYVIPLYKLLRSSHNELICYFIEKQIDKKECRDVIISEFASIDLDNDKYCELMKLRKSYYENSLTADAVREFITDFENIPACYADAVYFAVYKELPISSLKLDAYNVKGHFYNNAFFHFENFGMVVYNLYKTEYEDIDTNSKIWVSSLFYKELISGRLQQDMVQDIFAAYARTAYSAILDIFKSEIIQDECIRLLPSMYRVGYYCHCAIDSSDSGDDVKYIRYLRKALKQDKRLKDVVELLSYKVESKANKKQNTLSEFEAYAVQAKKAIIKLIEIGKQKEAAQFIETYESMCPNDPEIQEIKSKIQL